MAKEEAIEVEGRVKEALANTQFRVELDTANANDEIAKWNNTFVDPVRAQTYLLSVSRSIADRFAHSRNLVDTFINGLLKLRSRERVVDQAPLLRAFAFQPFGQS